MKSIQKSKITTPERRAWHRSRVSVVNFEQTSRRSGVFKVDFEQVNIGFGYTFAFLRTPKTFFESLSLLSLTKI